MVNVTNNDHKWAICYNKISVIRHIFQINIYVSSQHFYNRPMKGFKQDIRPEKWNSSFPYETFQVLNIQR